MLWSDFYYNDFTEWAESTLRSRISSLEDIGDGDEVVDAVLNLPGEKLKLQLIRKAMRLQAKFTHDDFMSLDGELSDEAYRELAAYAGFDASCPEIDESNLSWDDFYYAYDSDWDDMDTIRRIEKLKNFGTGEEVVDAALGMTSKELKVRLIRKAIRFKVKFSHEDFMNLEGELPYEYYQELAAYAGFNADCPEIDENNLTWGDFSSEYFCWNEEDTLRRIGKLKNLGDSDDVCDVICGMVDFDCKEALYEKARSAGLKFTNAQLEEMEFIDGDMAELEEDGYYHSPARRRSGPGLLGALLGALSALGGSGNKHDTGRCDGDCANCPPHYGYRYGRWYYGHGHRYGCQRGGNGGASGRTYRD